MVILLEAVESLVLVGADHIRDILLSVDIAYLALRVMLEHEVADGLDQVRFTQADARPFSSVPKTTST